MSELLQTVAEKYHALMKSQGYDSEEIEATVTALKQTLGTDHKVIGFIHQVFERKEPYRSWWVADVSGTRMDNATRRAKGYVELPEEPLALAQAIQKRQQKRIKEEKVQRAKKKRNRGAERRAMLEAMSPEEREKFHAQEAENARVRRLEENGGVRRKPGPKPGSTWKWKRTLTEAQRLFNRPR